MMGNKSHAPVLSRFILGSTLTLLLALLLALAASAEETGGSPDGTFPPSPSSLSDAKASAAAYHKDISKLNTDVKDSAKKQEIVNEIKKDNALSKTALQDNTPDTSKADDVKVYVEIGDAYFGRGENSLADGANQQIYQKYLSYKLAGGKPIPIDWSGAKDVKHTSNNDGTTTISNRGHAITIGTPSSPDSGSSTTPALENVELRFKNSGGINIKSTTQGTGKAIANGITYSIPNRKEGQLFFLPQIDVQQDSVMMHNGATGSRIERTTDGTMSEFKITSKEKFFGAGAVKTSGTSIQVKGMDGTFARAERTKSNEKTSLIAATKDQGTFTMDTAKMQVQDFSGATIGLTKQEMNGPKTTVKNIAVADATGKEISERGAIGMTRIATGDKSYISVTQKNANQPWEGGRLSLQYQKPAYGSALNVRIDDNNGQFPKIPAEKNTIAINANGYFINTLSGDATVRATAYLAGQGRTLAVPLHTTKTNPGLFALFDGGVTTGAESFQATGLPTSVIPMDVQQSLARKAPGNVVGSFFYDYSSSTAQSIGLGSAAAGILQYVNFINPNYIRDLQTRGPGAVSHRGNDNIEIRQELGLSITGSGSDGSSAQLTTTLNPGRSVLGLRTPSDSTLKNPLDQTAFESMFPGAATSQFELAGTGSPFMGISYTSMEPTKAASMLGAGKTEIIKDDTSIRALQDTGMGEKAFALLNEKPSSPDIKISSTLSKGIPTPSPGTAPSEESALNGKIVGGFKPGAYLLDMGAGLGFLLDSNSLAKTKGGYIEDQRYGDPWPSYYKGLTQNDLAYTSGWSSGGKRALDQTWETHKQTGGTVRQAMFRFDPTGADRNERAPPPSVPYYVDIFSSETDWTTGSRTNNPREIAIDLKREYKIDIGHWGISHPVTKQLNQIYINGIYNGKTKAQVEAQMRTYLQGYSK